MRIFTKVLFIIYISVTLNVSGIVLIFENVEETDSGYTRALLFEREQEGVDEYVLYVQYIEPDGSLRRAGCGYGSIFSLGPSPVNVGLLLSDASEREEAVALVAAKGDVVTWEGIIFDWYRIDVAVPLVPGSYDAFFDRLEEDVYGAYGTLEDLFLDVLTYCWPENPDPLGIDAQTVRSPFWRWEKDYATNWRDTPFGYVNDESAPWVWITDQGWHFVSNEDAFIKQGAGWLWSSGLGWSFRSMNNADYAYSADLGWLWFYGSWVYSFSGGNWFEL